MAELASEWGFVPFAASPSYPDLPADAAQRESGGKRSQKTDIRRRLQLEKLVEGIIKLPSTSRNPHAVKAKAESLQISTKKTGAASAAPNSGNDGSVHTSKSGAARTATSKPHVAGTADVSIIGVQQIQSSQSELLSDAKTGSSKSRKRKSGAVQPAELSAARNAQADCDPQLSRKQQKKRLRQQLYETRKHGHTLEEAQQHAQPDAVLTHTTALGSGQSGAELPSQGTGNTCTDYAHIGIEKQVAVAKPLTQKQQKGHERQQRYQVQQLARQSLAHTSADPAASSSADAEDHVTAAQGELPNQGPDDTCSDDVHIDIEKQVPAAQPTLTKKQQKRQERQERYQTQQLARQSLAHTSSELAASSSANAEDRVTAAQGIVLPDGQTANHALPHKAQPAQKTSEQRSNSGTSQTDTRFRKHLGSKPVPPSSAQVVSKPTRAVAPRLPPQHQSRAVDSGSNAPSGLLDKMRAKLQGGRFRWLNEQMYTSTGDNAFNLMQGEPDLYSQYHEGFRHQAADWPQQPVEIAISWLKNKPKDVVVADFGCGDARIAAEATQKVHSFDLVAELPGVVACNMASVPLESGSVDAAVFCLALMGTDYGAFLQEAHRVLKQKGWLWICEVRSRFAGQGSSAAHSDADLPSVEGSDVQQAAQSWVMVSFTKALQRLGFRLVQRRVVNKMFVVFELQKSSTKKDVSIEWPELKGCVYRKR